MYRYAFNGTLHHVRRWTYDMNGNITLVTRDHVNPARRDTAQFHLNTYTCAGGDCSSGKARLKTRMSYDYELEENTYQVFEYEPLDSLIEAR
jgi:hypothetical protein